MQRFFHPPKLVLPRGYLLLLLLFFFRCQSPDSDLSNGNRYFESKNYEKAVLYYKKVLDKKDRSNDIRTEAIQRLELSLFHAGRMNYRSKHYKKAIQYFDHLLTSFSKGLYKNKAQKLLNRSYFLLGERDFNENNYHGAIKSLRLLQKQADVSDELEAKSNNYLGKSLYHSALNHLNKKEYWLARERFLVLRYDFPKFQWMKKADRYLEESFYKDGQSKYEQKAYRNALRIFEKLISLYPKGIYIAKAKEYIQTISQKLPKVPKTDSKAKKKLSIKRSLEDKGRDKNDPFKNDDIVALIKYIKKEQARNDEYAKNVVLPTYLKKHVDLKNLKVIDWKKADDLANSRSKWLELFLKNYKSKNKQKPVKSYRFAYLVHTNTIGNVFIYLKEKDFYELDTNKKKTIKKLDVRGIIYKIKGNGSIKIFIVPETVKIYNLSPTKSRTSKS